MGPKLTQAEGFILGVGAKMFTIAGPVIVYGVSASVVYGLIYWFIQMVSGGCRPYIPENRFSVICADCYKICPGGGIIVICNADRFAFR